jgi:hypothetical protein
MTGCTVIIDYRDSITEVLGHQGALVRVDDE